MPTVLVVDDTPVDRCLVEGVLKRNQSLKIHSVPDALTALQWIESEAPDIVVTDLQMPRMNGLDLVTILRERFPGLPVVLITAHGSEELAVRAIEEGAVSYVPKTQLAERLLSTIDQILEASRSERGYLDFQACLRDARLRFEVGAQTHIIDQLADVARGMAGSVGLCDAHEQLRLAVALHGLLCLGFYAGNLELPIERLDELDVPDAPLHALVQQRRREPPFDARLMRVEIEVARQRGTFRVSHEGSPFVLSTLAADSVAREPRRRPYRGLVLLRAFADELSLEDGGRTIAMVCRQRAELETSTVGSVLK